MRLTLVCVLSALPFVALASDPETEPLRSSDGLGLQAVLDTFAAAWLAGDRPALERVLHEDYTYYTAPEGEGHTWDRNTEIGFAATMAESKTVRSLSVTVTEIEKGSAGEFSVKARLDSHLVFAVGDSSEVSTDVLFVLKRDPSGPLRVWRQVALSGAKQ